MNNRKTTGRENFQPGCTRRNFIKYTGTIVFTLGSIRCVARGQNLAHASEAVDSDRLGSWRAALPLELNGDGVPDLLLTDVVGWPRLYLSEGCTSAGWVEVEGPAHSRVEVQAGGETHVGWIQPEQGYGATGPRRLHLGLGPVEELERVTVTTLDGQVAVLEGPAPARQRLQVRLDP